MSSVSARSRLYLTLCAFYLVISALLRCGLWVGYGLDAQVGATSLPYLLGVGALNDLIQLLFLTSLISLYLFVLPNRAWRSKLHARAIFPAIVFAIIFFLVYLPPTEVLFFDEFNSRFNLVAVDYLLYPTEVLGNIWESYPIVWIMLGIALISAVLFRFLWPQLRPALATTEQLSSRAIRFGLHLALVAIAGIFISANSFLFSPNRVANEIAANGISSFFRAVRSEEINYDLYYKTLPREQAFSVMRNHLAGQGVQFASSDIYDLNRVVPQDPNGLGKMNVVFLVEESLGSQFVDSFSGLNRGLSPKLDALAPQGLMFANTYATGTRTVRGLEALSASFPPIPSESVVKRAGCENIATIGGVLAAHGYSTSFLYGGFGAFDNMNYFFRNNAFAISDRLDIPEPRFGNIWGVSDQDLLSHALDYFDARHAEQKPFFSLIMSTSNHKPFTFPPGVPGVPEQGGGREAGARYADFAIGEFIENAKKHDWFKNTLFVIVADHDSRVYGRAYIPVERYRIPLIIYAPEKIAPKRIEKIMSQLDVAPTVLGLLGIGYTAPFYGVDALKDSVPANRPVPISHNHNVAIYQGDKLSVLGLQKVESTFRYSKEATEKIETDTEMTTLAAAYFQTAYELFINREYRLRNQ